MSSSPLSIRKLTKVFEPEPSMKSWPWIIWTWRCRPDSLLPF